jgi:hypothetical protein
MKKLLFLWLPLLMLACCTNPNQKSLTAGDGQWRLQNPENYCCNSRFTFYESGALFNIYYIMPTAGNVQTCRGTYSCQDDNIDLNFYGKVLHCHIIWRNPMKFQLDCGQQHFVFAKAGSIADNYKRNYEKISTARQKEEKVIF